MQNAKEKIQIRELFLQKRLNLNKEDIEAKSRRICLNLFVNFFLLEGNIGIYMPIKNEVNLLFLSKYGVSDFSLPVMEGDKIIFKKWKFGDALEVQKYNIPEPSKKAKTTIPDCIVVPLIAFDKNLGRIGYGGGFYDKFLQNFKGLKIGVAFEMQKCTEIPQENFDIKLDYIITEDKLYS